MKSVKELATEIHTKIKQERTLHEEIDELVETVNEVRSQEAVEAVKRQLRIEAGTFLRQSNGQYLQVEKVEAANMSRYSFDSKIEWKSGYRATCFVLHRGTGKPIEKRGRYHFQADGRDRRERVVIDINERTVIASADEVMQKRVKATKSDAVKRLATLSPKELESLLKKANL